MAKNPNRNNRSAGKGGAGRTPRKRAASPHAKTNDAQGPEPSGNGIFPIVGVGASAGGLEAFTQLLHALPTDTGMAFVLVQHLHPDFQSALTEILSRETSMPVSEIQDRTQVAPNHVYVIPPSADLQLMHGKLHLLPRKVHELTMPIDQFFRSLAADQGGRAVGVILSGTASDGVLGLKAVKAEGGITFAQDEATAKYDGMPHSAIAAGVVDFVLPPDKIAQELAQLARHPYVSRTTADTAAVEPPLAGDTLEKIFLLLRTHTGHDFTYYKHSTIQRRIARRMLLHKLANQQDYVRYLQENRSEIDLLFHDILINVTSFFRDPEAFEALAEKTFPGIAKRPAGTPIRVWVPGCSTGEEAYSIAIALIEHLGERAAVFPIQIFATDIDELAIERARNGIYPEDIIQDVGPARLGHFFSKVEGGYQISKTVRDMCVFAVQDIIKDPPFSRIDLISCRNLLIYLGSMLQKKVLTIFHYALNPQGYLFLGTAESVGGLAELFVAADAKEKVYAKKAVVTPHAPFGISPEVPAARLDQPAVGRQVGTGFDIEREADRLLMSQYAPSAVVINEHRDILHFHGRTGRYLEPSPGQASLNLMKMARDNLPLALNAAVREAVDTGSVARRRDVKVRDGGGSWRVNIEVTPITGPGLVERYFLVVFQDVPPPEELAKEEEGAEKPTDSEVKRLEAELAANREYLQSVIEQQETSNEELRSANEEIQSSNEELQSINEELETAKEELQSTNEELSTVNDELSSRAQELEQANSDLGNLISSMGIPIVIVGSEMHIRRFTPQAEKLLNLISTDVGRPISDIRPNVVIPAFETKITEVIEKAEPVQYDVPDASGHWYSLWIHPYKTLNNEINGAVIAFIDIDRLKRSLEATRQAHEYSEAIIAAIRNPLLVLDRNLSVVSVSNSYKEVFQVDEKETLGNLVYRLGNSQWAIPQLRARLEEAVETGTEFKDFIVTHDFPKIGEKTMSVSGRRIPTGVMDEPMVLMQIEDRTENATAHIEPSTRDE